MEDLEERVEALEEEIKNKLSLSQLIWTVVFFLIGMKIVGWFFDLF